MRSECGPDGVDELVIDERDAHLETVSRGHDIDVAKELRARYNRLSSRAIGRSPTAIAGASNRSSAAVSAWWPPATPASRRPTRQSGDLRGIRNPRCTR
jgi:hypothetical protein